MHKDEPHADGAGGTVRKGALPAHSVQENQAHVTQ